MKTNLYKIIRVYSVIIITFLKVQPLNAVTKDFNLNSGVHNIAGAFTLPITYDRYSNLKLDLNIEGSYGYFIRERLELRFSAYGNIEKTINNKPQFVSAPLYWGFKAEAIYFFKTRALIYPFIGIGLGMEAADWNLFSLSSTLNIPIGVLIPLSKNVAFDISMPFSVKTTVRSNTDTIRLKFGFVGFRYYI